LSVSISEGLQFSLEPWREFHHSCASQGFLAGSPKANKSLHINRLRGVVFWWIHKSIFAQSMSELGRSS
jgi:hypothetical protein